VIKTVILIFLYSYLAGLCGVLLYYLYLYWYAVSTAYEYNMQLDNWEIERKGIFFMFCPVVNCAAAIMLWLLIPNEKARIRFIIIMSTHPDTQDDDDDEW
jgi:hypothetical protein